MLSRVRDEGRYAEAEQLLKRAAAIREKTLGPDDPDLAESLNYLAAVYQAQGRYAKAEPLYKRALAINEKALGPDHSDVATILNNLARRPSRSWRSPYRMSRSTGICSWNSRSDLKMRRAAPAPRRAWHVGRPPVDRIRGRFGWDAIGYGSVALGNSGSVPEEFRKLAEKDL
jgi:tetratricopeptide (TPR) repeat protein